MKVSTLWGPDWESERKQPTLSTDCTRIAEQTSFCLHSAHSASGDGGEMHGAAACVCVYAVRWRLHHVFLWLISPAVYHRLLGRNQKCKRSQWWKSFNRKSDVNRITETSSWWYHGSLFLFHSPSNHNSYVPKAWLCSLYVFSGLLAV